MYAIRAKMLKIKANVQRNHGQIVSKSRGKIKASMPIKWVSIPDPIQVNVPEIRLFVIVTVST